MKWRSDAGPEAQHRVQGGQLSQPGGVLPEAHRHVYDPGKRLHPELPVLRRHHRTAPAAGPGVSPYERGKGHKKAESAPCGADLFHRDDLPGGGAKQFAKMPGHLEAACPGTTWRR